ncbi:hypothetical protein G1H11_17530 [Phytoactinopolyspora alkaliphila]|uniref:Uncharacterized protein n=1 Tax=Phytoactinopolyspora alkaliphila TaxID=1783498 RepID=A0A6N9YQ55_9ACTN|nr:hypothetical protein [Phytoactinopolyspora alkaliphila]NED97104.1 hypothetical protein [Phytoactinopolyspora alkaliphila]
MFGSRYARAGAADLLGGRRAALLIGDPFDLITELGTSSLAATLASVDAFDAGADREGVLAALPTPLAGKGTAYKFVAIQARHGPASLRNSC